MSKEKISVIVPCYNEEEVLPIFYEEIDRVSKEMHKVDFEFLFINDGSKDKTLNILRELAKKDKKGKIYFFFKKLWKRGRNVCWFK